MNKGKYDNNRNLCSWGRKREESFEFYDLLQTHLNSVNKTDYLVLCGDFNAKIGKQLIGKILGTNGENGKHLINFASLNEFKITITFFLTQGNLSICRVPETQTL